MRDNAGAHPILVAIGALALAIVSGVFLAASALLTEDGSQRESLRSFYFEARVQVPEAEDDDLLGEVKGWYEAPGRWRYEFASPDPTRAHETVVQVSDGEQVWLYRGETNTYSTSDAGQYLANFGLGASDAPPPPSFGLLLGPAPLGDVDAYLQAIAEAGNTTMTTYTRERTIAGRRADRVDMQGPGAGTSSVWVDQDYSFILGFETPYASSSPADAGSGKLRAEVLAVELNGDVDDSIFAFDLPPGAREEPPDDGISIGSGSSGSLGEGVPPPEGFMAPGYLPAGYQPRGFESTVTSNETTSYTVTYGHEDDSARTLRVAQNVRAGGLAESQRTGEPIDVTGTPGYLQRNGDHTTLLWAEGDLVIRVTANALDVDELMRVAESMRP